MKINIFAFTAEFYGNNIPVRLYEQIGNAFKVSTYESFSIVGEYDRSIAANSEMIKPLIVKYTIQDLLLPEVTLSVQIFSSGGVELKNKLQATERAFRYHTCWVQLYSDLNSYNLQNPIADYCSVAWN